MFGALDPAKILMILVIALIVLGPERLPKAARQLGSYWRTLVQLRGRLEQEFREAIPDFKEAMPDLSDLPKLPKNPRAAMSGFITGLISEGPKDPAADGEPEPPTADDAATVSSNGSGMDPVPVIAGSEMAAVTAAWRAAGDGAGTDEPPSQMPRLEQRGTRDYAPFVDDASMN